MNKISFSQLESARKSPSAFAKSLNDGGNPFRSKKPAKFTIWKNAVFNYHKEKNNLSKAIKYFESSYLKHYVDNRKNVIECGTWIEDLHIYVNDEIERKLSTFDRKLRVSIPLTHKIKLGGELPLIKMNNKGGYSIYFFSRESTAWEGELRFPIIQYFVATSLYNVDLSEVEVGVYSLDFKKHLQMTYSASDVEDAIIELNSIGKAVSSFL